MALEDIKNIQQAITVAPALLENPVGCVSVIGPAGARRLVNSVRPVVVLNLFCRFLFSSPLCDSLVEKHSKGKRTTIHEAKATEKANSHKKKKRSTDHSKEITPFTDTIEVSS